MTMKEACAYLKESRRAKNQEHHKKVMDEHGYSAIITRGFNEIECRKALVDIRTGGKKNYNKYKKPAYNGIWKHYATQV